jgi:predicted lipid carrier protein YhbT
MSAPSHAALPGSSFLARLQDVPRLLLAPVPLALLQPVFDRIAAHVARSRPELFARLGPHTRKRYLIDPTDIPFVLVLVPDAARPCLKAYRRYENPAHDACIAGGFFNLLEMIDGALDGDALFFSRDLHVSGDTEAVVALRNALDDFDGSVVDSVVESLGPLSRPAALTLSALRAIRAGSRHG